MRRNHYNEKGLTLLELVLALAISGLVLVILSSAMFMGIRSEEKAAQRSELSQKIRAINERITWLIRGAYPFARTSEDGRILYFDGKDDSIGFVTTSTFKGKRSLEDRAGLKWVNIYLDDNSLKIKEKVFFVKDVFDDSGGKEYTLFNDISDIRFEYFDVDSEDREDSWKEEWDPKEREALPAAVKVRITIIHRDEEIELPPFIVKIEARKGIT